VGSLSGTNIIQSRLHQSGNSDPRE
jgi:hypothetical protein